MSARMTLAKSKLLDIKTKRYWLKPLQRGGGKLRWGATEDNNLNRGNVTKLATSDKKMRATGSRPEPVSSRRVKGS